MKDLKDYIHLYLGQRCVIKFVNKEGYSAPVTLSLECLRATLLPEIHRDHIKIKLLLRPLSDATEEEEHEWSELSGVVCTIKDRAEEVKYLLSKGFDLFGLIEADLAIDKTKLETVKR